jgi:hypothetical protein
VKAKEAKMQPEHAKLDETERKDIKKKESAIRKEAKATLTKRISDLR